MDFTSGGEASFPWLRHAPGSPAERAAFLGLQRELAPMFARIMPDPMEPRTVVVVPSLSLDAQELAKIAGVHHYEERLLCLLLLLQLPRTHIIYASSQPIQPCIIDYYLHLLPGVPSSHARKRLTLVNCHDASSAPLTRKLLERPRMLARIQEAIIAPESSHLVCFNTTPLEQSLSVQLELPLFGCDPALSHLGDKSHGRELFRRAGIALAEGFEHLRDERDMIDALVSLKSRDPALRKAVVKLNEGFSGEGNAIFSFADAPEVGLESWVQEKLPLDLRFEAPTETWESYRHKYQQMGGIVECWIEGEHKESPSVQCRIEPSGPPLVLSTHDQVLGGPTGQIFLGCTFPAAAEYRFALHDAGQKISEQLQQKGVLGRFGVDFISVKEGQQWKHYAIEINLRKGGTTLPFLMLQYLTNGEYDLDSGLYRSPRGQALYYYASDNLQDTAYRGLTPEDLIEILVDHRLYFNSVRQEGVVFHLMGALSEFGKLGVVCIGDSYERAQKLYQDTFAALKAECPSRGQ